MAVRVIIPIIRHAVDEEQREHLDAPLLDLQLLLEMPFDGVLDLASPNVLAQAADLLSQPQRAAVPEAQILAAWLGTDLGDLVAVAVHRSLLGLLQEIVTLLDGYRLLLGAAGGLYVNAELGLDSPRI